MNKIQPNNEKLGFAGKLAHLFVSNQRMGLLVILALFFWGIVSFVLMPKQYNPEIVAPAFQVITEFPGATSSEVKELVTKPLEEKITDIHGVDEVLSQSVDGGVSIVTVKFHVGEELESSKVKIIQKIYGNMDEAPVGISEPIIKEISVDDVPVLTVALSSQVLSSIELRELALNVADEFKKEKDATNIEVIGGRKEQFKIILNPSELVAKNVDIYEVIAALEFANTRVLAGDIESGSRGEQIEIDGTVKSIEELKKIVVRNESGELIYLEDVARVTQGEAETEDYVRLQKPNEKGQETVYISAAKRKGTNITNVTAALLDRLESLQNNLIPDTVTIDIVRDEGVTAKEEIYGLMVNLFQSILIVSAILFLALGRKPAIIVGIAIPLTLASVFGVGLLMGQTLNRITLFALILSLGLLVDNATVVVENVVRHIKCNEQCHDHKISIVQAVDEVGGGLVMSTITTLLAFFPMAFVTGMMGPYMGPIPFFVPAALIISLIVSFTINPYLSAKLLRLKDVVGQEEGVFQKKLADIETKYRTFLKKLLNNDHLQKKVLKTISIAFLISLLLPLFGIVKFRMLPKADREQFYVYLDLPEGTLVEHTNEVSLNVEQFFLNQNMVTSVQSYVGTGPIIDFNGLFKGASGRNQSNQATLKVNLTHHDNRSLTSEEIVQQLRSDLKTYLITEPDVKFKLIEDPPGPPVLATVLVKIKGDDYSTLEAISKDIEKMFAATKEVVDIDTTRSDYAPEIDLQINYDRASQSQISPRQIGDVMYVALSGLNISTIHDNEAKEQKFIHLIFDKDASNELSDLNKIFLTNPLGQQIPLTSLVDQVYSSEEPIIYRDNQEDTVYVMAEMGDRSVTYAFLDLFQDYLRYDLPSGSGKVSGVSFIETRYTDELTGENYKIEWGGEWDLTVDVFRDLGLAMIVAIFLIYFVLVGQFHSFKTPVLIMVTIPLSMIGVLPGFAILGFTSGLYFNATSMIGVIALAGIVVNNAIILIEYLNQLKKEGHSAKEALIEAGATRLRPIVLTSLTTILASLTIIGDPVWAGLAWAIICGLSISTALTLIIFPVLYFIFEGKDWDLTLKNN